ncbi:MAG: Omp28-related outer membrane protein [Flavobacteriales bacterium]|nr:Omp28-related outer membrane protein [Flavobacteriales bacterium]
MKKLLLSVGCVLAASVSFGQTTILNEDFEGGALPSGWQNTHSSPSVGWEFGNALGSTYWAVPTHTKYAASNDDAHDNSSMTANVADKDRLVTTSLDLSAFSVVFLKYDAYFNGTYGSVATVEVSTNGGTSWTTVSTLTGVDGAWQEDLVVNLSAYAGNANVLVAFRHNDSGQWASGFAVDNVNIYSPAANDVALTDLSYTQYVVGPSNLSITGTITNLGSNTITSVDIDWNDGSAHNQTFSVSIPPLGTYNFTHGTQLAVAAGTNYNITVTVTLGGDANTADNTMGRNVYGLTFLPTKRVVGEEGTGTWCGWCPRGAVFMDQMATTYPNTWVGVAVHNSDPMTVTAYDNAIGALISGYPSGVVDRDLLDVDPSDFPTAYSQLITKVAPANIGVTSDINLVTRAMTVTVTADWAGSFTGIDYRLAAIVIEDNVHGTTSGYNQTNYYSSTSQNLPLNGAGHNWQTEPNPVPAANMEYDHVGRALLGGFAGQAGSVPSSVTAGSSTSYTFNHTLPTTQNENNIKVAGILIDNATGKILNAAEADLVLGIAEDAAPNFDMNIFPNPANDFAAIKLNILEAGEVNISIVSVTGALVSSFNYGTLSGENTFMIDGNRLDAGIYFVNVNVNGSVISKKVVITH